MGREIGITEIRQAILALAVERGAGKSFCPSEVARRLAEDWRPLMPLTRSVAAELQEAGLVQATRQGRPVHPETADGPIRLALAAGPHPTQP
ncbi:MAG: DUF3253 domain-containing protein [Rhodobacteraceae bacterium]|nr:DUF3253 domain-containing protein [Paracoccaceae bacterium]